MTKIECVIRPEKLEAVIDALGQFGNPGMTVSEVKGCGLQRGWKEVYRGVEANIRLLSKVKIEVVVKDENVDQAVQLICRASRTGEVGDGKIFIYPVANAVRIRTGETGESAIY
jgi:nitrogen regulatory protein P-II 1